jgi:hypothetical protein
MVGSVDVLIADPPLTPLAVRNAGKAFVRAATRARAAT